MENKNIPTGVGIAVIIIFAITAGAFVWKYEELQNKEETLMSKDVAPQALKNRSAVSETIQEQTKLPINEADLIKKGSIVWQEPTNLGDLGLTTRKLYQGCKSGDCFNDDGVSSDGVKYVKVGNIVSGDYNGSELILLVSYVHDGPGWGEPSIYRIIRKGNDLTLLSRGLDDYITGYIETYFSQGSSKLISDSKTVIEELEFPDSLDGENDRQKFKKDIYVDGFFTDAKLRPAFVSEQYGQVWVTDSVKALNENLTPFELNSYYDAYAKKKGYHDVFGKGGFYFKAPDGTVVAYKLVLDIFDKMDRFGKLQATWNDGTKNEIRYEENPSGCGGGDYVYDKTTEIDLNKDVMVVGKTDKGDNLYGYRSADSKEIKDMYENNYYSGDDKKVAIEEYLKMNPVVFWVDPFGRTLAFYREDLISPAECGKPVIYLYPEQPMNVSVQVKPGNGLSYTEPEYGKGWNVFADTKSNLKNLADGKTYPYLFWEGSGGAYYEQPKQGFVVAKDDLDGFFNEKLAQLGLVGKEIADFKEYWVPKMTGLEKPYYFVTFLSKHYIDELAPLAIIPKPETVIRVLMDYKGLDKRESVDPILLTAPERKGFTAVEWGGFLK